MKTTLMLPLWSTCCVNVRNAESIKMNVSSVEEVVYK